MNETVQILAPFNNVNDETVVLLEWFFPDMSEVKKGDIVLSFETSKANVELEAPSDGYLVHKAKVGDEVAIGGVLAWITTSLSNSPGDSNYNSSEPYSLTHRDQQENLSLNGQEVAAPGTPTDREPRFTPVAKKMIDSLGIDYSNFAGQQLVRSDDVLALSSQSKVESTCISWPVTRFTAQAQSLMQQHSLSTDLFTGYGLVRSSDILQLINGIDSSDKPAIINTTAQHTTQLPAQPSLIHSQVPSVGIRKEAVSKRKKAEIRNLTIGKSASVTSSITVACNTNGFRNVLQSQPVLEGNPTALVVFEAARLLHHFPVFNAYYASGEICFYEEINIGFTIDAGFGLKVPVIKNADKKSLSQIAHEMNTCISLYLEDQLRQEHLTGGTFTISDLSGEGVFSFEPLISEGQSAILGIGGENLLHDDKGIYTLTLSFDHQATEGRMAAHFLNRLKLHLTAYEESLGNATETVSDNSAISSTLPEAGIALSEVEELACYRCLRDMNSLGSLKAYLIPTVDKNRTVRLICTICMGGF